MGAEHPELAKRKDYMLAGILERLGCLLAHLKIPDPVADITPLTDDYLTELFAFADQKAKEIREAIDTPDGR